MPASAWNNAKWTWTSAKPDAWLILIATTFSSSQKVFANRATCATYISHATIPEFQSKAELTMSTNAQAAAGGSWIWDQRKPRAARCCQTHAMPASAWNNAKWTWTSAKPDAWLILIATTFSSSQKISANRATCATYISRATISEFRS